YARNIATTQRVIIDYPGIKVEYFEREENPNYLFIGLNIGPGTNEGSFQIRLLGEDHSVLKEFYYSLAVRNNTATLQSPPLSSKDFIYLIMPDRFANGDEANDSVEGTTQTGVNREKFLFRHGGDLIGVMEHLDYLQDLGVTAIWLNPVLENDQPYESYHGYAVTDHYRIDPRLGTNEQYRQLVQLAHERGIKVIMDVIFNHVGDHHWQIKDLPSTDWIHQWPAYTQTTYRATTLLDPNASEHDRQLMTDGWFDKHMPDLNQQNPHLARYLIQNSIWWTLYSGQDGFRIDTYAYPDPHFMAEWNRRMLEEFPGLGVFGETWVHGPAVQAWFTESETLHPGFNTQLPGVTDFQIYYAINDALSKEPGWTDGVMRLYYTLAQDYLYENPNRNVVFLDNHDLARFFTVVNQDVTKFKSGLTLLMTLRGIPMIYYGTEFAFTGAGGAFGEGGRVDFPGGWAGDATNLFSSGSRNEQQKDLHQFVRKLANFRKNSPALTEGKLTQFVPRDGVYAYFRHTNNERIMVLFNGSSQTRSVDLSPYAEQLN
ncbi:MAG: alpha-amylase family glycosyl hydrolase, partial [Bacteroidota bacterium]